MRRSYTRLVAKLLDYVGPAEVRGRPNLGRTVRTYRELTDAVGSLGTGPLTFVIDPSGQLRLAPRESEHVNLADGRPVLAAGEMAFDVDDDVKLEIGGPVFVPGATAFDSWRISGTGLSRRAGNLHRGEVTVTAGDGQASAMVVTIFGKRSEPDHRKLIAAVLAGSTPVDVSLPLAVTVEERMVTMDIGGRSIEALAYDSGSCWTSEFGVDDRDVRVLVRGVPPERLTLVAVDDPGSLPNARLSHNGIE